MATGEEKIRDAMLEELSKHVAKHVQFFRFARNDKEVATHYLFWVGKHPKGRELITDIMGKRSSRTVGGVPTFEFEPRGESLLFVPDQIEQLAAELLKRFEGRTVTVEEVYEEHSVLPGRQFQRKHYKDALRRLESREDIECTPPAHHRPPGTLADKTTVVFF